MYQTSDNYKSKIYNVTHLLKIYINSIEIDSKYVLDCKPSKKAFSSDEFTLGCVEAQSIDLKLYKSVVPETINKIEIKSGITGEIVPVGIFNVDEISKDDDYTVTLKLRDNMIKFEFNYDGRELINNNGGKAKIIQVLQDLCSKAKVELGSTSFLNMNKEIAVYDNTISARIYLSYIAEQAGGIATIGRDGKLYIKIIGEKSTILPLKLFKTFKWGEKFKITRIRYDDGTQIFEKGDTTGNTVYINQDNMYIVDKEQIDNIYNSLKDLEFYSFEGESIIDPALDTGDIVVIDGKNVIYQGSMQFSGRWVASIESKIQCKSKEETTRRIPSQKTINRRVRSEINQAEGKITQLTQETSENTEKIAKHEQTIDSINDKVSNIADLTKTSTNIKTLTLDNCANGELLQLNIYGNNTIFKSLVLGDDLYLSDELYLTDVKSIVTVTDENGNTTDYDLKITDTLRRNEEIKDEYILENGKAKIIRRINLDGSVKDNEEIEDLEELHIVLEQGTNTIEIKDYSAEIQVKWAQKSELTNTFATKVEMNTGISQTSAKIMSEVNKKVDEEELGTKIEQDYESVQVAWNKISDFIKMMVFNNNASLCIVDKSKNVIASFDKEGEHFYKSGETIPFGEMGVQTLDNKQYIAFSVEGEYESNISNGMAWGIKTKSDGKFFPIFYIKDFNMGAKDSDTGGGSLVLTAADIILNGLGTGITTGGIRIEGDPSGKGLYFYDANNPGKYYLMIFPEDSIGEASIHILDKLKFYKNQVGSNSFKIGDENAYVLLTDDGDISTKNGNVILGSENAKTSFSVYDNNANFWGNLNVSGNVYADNISSDRRIKENIKDSTENAIDLIKKIQHKEFDKKDDGKHYKIGYIAQEMEKIDSNFVIKRPEDKERKVEERYYINELPILATLTKAIQEQQQQIEQLQNKVNEMEMKLNEINKLD